MSALFQKTSFHIFSLFLTTLLLSLALFMNGFPIGHDYPFLYVTYEVFRAQILDGEIYPRWLKDLYLGYGGGTLFLYPPFTFFFRLCLDALTGFTLSIDHVNAISMSAMLFLSGLSMYVFTRHITTPVMACVLSAFFIILPYHSWIEISYRNAMAELGTYIWVPLLFLCLNLSIQKRSFFLPISILYALLILTNLPSALCISFFLGLYVLYHGYRIEKSRDRYNFLKYFSLSIILGLGLSALYLYPALTLLPHMQYEALWKDSYKGYFLPSICHGECSFQNILPAILLIQGISAFLFYLNFSPFLKEETKKNATMYIVICMICAFMITPLSMPLWFILIPLQKIQFPWRMLLMLDFFYITILAHISTIKPWRKTVPFLKKTLLFSLITLHLFFILILSLYMNTIKSPYISADLLQKILAGRISTSEHIPKNSNFSITSESITDFNNRPFWIVPSGEAKIELIKHAPRLILLDVNAQTPITLEFRQFHFFAWRIKIDGKDITEQSNVRDGSPDGQLTIDVPKGQYRLAVSMDMTWEEKIGYLISFLSFLALIGWFFALKHEKSRSRKKRLDFLKTSPPPPPP